MKKLIIASLAAVGLTGIGIVRAGAEDLTDKLQISGIAQAAWPLGDKAVTNASQNVGPDFGGMVGYGVSKTMSFGFSYDNIDLGKGTRVQPILFNLIYRMFSDRRWTPNFQVGGGLVEGNDSSFDHASAKAGLGLEYFVCSHLSVGPQVTYIYAANQTPSERNAHIVTAGLLATMFFGGSEPAPAEKQAATPAPVPVAVAVALSPTDTTLGPGQSVQLTPAISGTSNAEVAWTISPTLGTISSTGTYTAPASIVLAETVVVTATSMADNTKTGTSQIKLTPPASAPKEISMRLEILFDNDKAVIKPQYDREIAKVAEFMKTYPHCKAEIDGYTDNVGRPAYNQDLSQRRADSVRAYMIAKFDIASSRLTAKGNGETKPIASNATAAGRAQNRRVVAVLTATTE